MTSQQPTGHDKAVRAVMDASDCSRAEDVNGTPYCEAHWVGWLSDVDACVRAERIAHEVLAALRAALAAGDPDVAEALGLSSEGCCDGANRDREEFGKYSVYTCGDEGRACRRRFVTDWTEA